MTKHLIEEYTLPSLKATLDELVTLGLSTCSSPSWSLRADIWYQGMRWVFLIHKTASHHHILKTSWH